MSAVQQAGESLLFSESLQKKLGSIVFECEIRGSHTIPFRDAVRCAAASLTQQTAKSLQGRIAFLEDLAPIDSQIFVKMFRASTSIWGMEPNLDRENEVKFQHQRLLLAVEKSIEKSNTQPGLEALKS